MNFFIKAAVCISLLFQFQVLAYEGSDYSLIMQKPMEMTEEPLDKALEKINLVYHWTSARKGGAKFTMHLTELGWNLDCSGSEKACKSYSKYSEFQTWYSVSTVNEIGKRNHVNGAKEVIGNGLVLLFGSPLILLSGGYTATTAEAKVVEFGRQKCLLVQDRWFSKSLLVYNNEHKMADIFCPDLIFSEHTFIRDKSGSHAFEDAEIQLRKMAENLVAEGIPHDLINEKGWIGFKVEDLPESNHDIGVNGNGVRPKNHASGYIYPVPGGHLNEFSGNVAHRLIDKTLKYRSFKDKY